MPAPRAEQPMTPDQVKQATDALISDRYPLERRRPGRPSKPAPPATTGSTQARWLRRQAVIKVALLRLLSQALINA